MSFKWMSFPNGQGKNCRPEWRRAFVVLFLSTIFGCLMAQWTRWDLGHQNFPKSVQTGLLPHTIVLGVWTSAWIRFWSICLGGFGGELLAVGISLVAAAIAEGIQKYLPGHEPNLQGLFDNLIGVSLACVFCWRELKQLRAAVGFARRKLLSI